MARPTKAAKEVLRRMGESQTLTLGFIPATGELTGTVFPGESLTRAMRAETTFDISSDRTLRLLVWEGLLEPFEAEMGQLVYKTTDRPKLTEKGGEVATQLAVGE